MADTAAAMMPQTIHLIRHGQSTFNAAWTARRGVDPMIFDPRLTELGERQVAELRQRVAGLAVELVVTSPLTRAIQTALGAFHGRGIPILVEALHREWLEHSGDVGRAPALLAAEFPELIFDHLPAVWWHPQPGPPIAVESEPTELLTARVGEFRDWLASRPERVIAVVGHGTFLNRLSGHNFDNCELFTLPADR